MLRNALPLRLHALWHSLLEGLSRWPDASPWAWLLVLALGAPWVRLRLSAPWVLYPGHGLLALALGALLIPGLVQRLRAAGGNPRLLPLVPLLALLGWMALVALFRAQWSVVTVLLLAGLANACWGLAAYALGQNPRPAQGFQPAAHLFLAATLAVGVLAWVTQQRWPEACQWFNCQPSAAPPYEFLGGWQSHTQYVLLLALLLPALAEPLVQVWRAPRVTGVQGLLSVLAGAAGLALLAGMRWWGFLVLGAGWMMLRQLLREERQPADRLFLRGVAFLGLFAATVLYGLVPGYLGTLFDRPGAARRMDITHALTLPAALSSEHPRRIPIRVVNRGPGPLEASLGRPIQVQALLLFTPRAGGESRVVPGGSGDLTTTLQPGQGAALDIPVRLPPWMYQGYLTWQAQDAAGARIQVGNAQAQGFRFTNLDYTSLETEADNTLSALAARATTYLRDSRPPGRSRSGRSLGAALDAALDTLFFSPLWGRSARDQPQPWDTQRPLPLELLHRYGLVGLGLGVWVFLDVLRRSWQLAYGRGRGAPLSWRLVPASVLLLGAMALFSGEPGSYHSLWGLFLLSGFVQGVHERAFPTVLRGTGRLGQWSAAAIRAARLLATWRPRPLRLPLRLPARRPPRRRP